MSRSLLALSLGALLLLPGCYHARVETGRTPGSTVVEKPWASGFIAGLIPPSTVNVASECPDGVAVVETQHSFLNMLAQFVTFSLYSPMHIKVTCAAAGTASLDADAEVVTVREGATAAEVGLALAHAGEVAGETGAQVYVSFE